MKMRPVDYFKKFYADTALFGGGPATVAPSSRATTRPFVSTPISDELSWPCGCTHTQATWAPAAVRVIGCGTGIGSRVPTGVIGCGRGVEAALIDSNVAITATAITMATSPANQLRARRGFGGRIAAIDSDINQSTPLPRERFRGGSHSKSDHD